MQRRSNRSGKQTSNSSQATVIFWIVFIVAVIAVFMMNAETIKRNFDVFFTRLNTSPGQEELPLMDDDEDLIITFDDLPVVSVIPNQPAEETTVTPSAQPETQEQRPQEQTPVEQSPQEQRPQEQRPAEQPAQQQQPQEQRPVETRDRNIYFTQIDNDGQILHSRVTRRLPVSNSPLQDSLNAMLTGPSAEELNRGLLNLIPANTRILLTTVRGNTAYISFSEDFLFNTFGVEGYIAQLRQVVWTATEFSNVSDVQILIEGRRLDFLGDGIWIGSPISRQSF